MACAVHTPYFFVVRYFADRVKKSGLEILFSEKFLLTLETKYVIYEEIFENFCHCFGFAYCYCADSSVAA